MAGFYGGEDLGHGVGAASVSLTARSGIGGGIQGPVLGRGGSFLSFVCAWVQTGNMCSFIHMLGFDFGPRIRRFLKGSSPLSSFRGKRPNRFSIPLVGGFSLDMSHHITAQLE